MPQKFEDVVKSKGKFKTKKIGPDTYVNVHYDKDGKAYVGPKFSKKEIKGKQIEVEKTKIKEEEKQTSLKATKESLLKLKEYFEKYNAEKAKEKEEKNKKKQK